MDKDQLKERTKQFAQRCIKLSPALPDSCLGNHIEEARELTAIFISSRKTARKIVNSK